LKRNNVSKLVAKSSEKVAKQAPIILNVKNDKNVQGKIFSFFIIRAFLNLFTLPFRTFFKILDNN